MREYNKQKTIVDSGKQNKKLHLRITGFDLQSIITVNNIVEKINHIPTWHLAGLKEIRYDPNRETINLITKSPTRVESPNTKGIYLQGYRTIAIYDFKSEKELFTILFHELGHYVYYTIINSIIKKKWVTEVHPVKKYVTNYARVNASEDFAECYAGFLLNPNNLVRIQQKYNFIRNELFNGIPYHDHFNN